MRQRVSSHTNNICPCSRFHVQVDWIWKYWPTLIGSNPVGRTKASGQLLIKYSLTDRRRLLCLTGMDEAGGPRCAPEIDRSVFTWLHFATSFGGVDILFPDTVEAEWQSRSTSICAIQAGAQLCVFCLRLPVDGNIGVGILPNRQEILIRFSRYARILHEYLSTR
jgi:hypothetical protein